MAASRFCLPQNQQASSPLLNLPSELRFIILRYLLKQDEVIASTARADRRDAGFYSENGIPFKEGHIPSDESSIPPIDLSSFRSLWKMVQETERVTPEICPHILITCQRLRQEGLPIFCEENRLEILWSPAATGLPSCLTSYCCDILNGSKAYDTYPEDFQIDHDESDMNSASSPSVSQGNELPRRYHKIPYLNFQAQQLQKLGPIVSKFTKFHIKVELLNSAADCCLVMCRALRVILEGRDVTVELRHLDNGEPYMEEKWLRYFRVLRCKSFTFLGPHMDSMDEVVRLITSNEPIQDTFRMWKSLWTSPFAPDPDEPDYQIFKMEMLSISVHEICKYDLEAYGQWREEAFKRLKDSGFDKELLRQMALENSRGIPSD